MTTTVDIEETSAELADLLSLTREGTKVIIAQGSRLLARLVPMPDERPRIGNLSPGSITASGDSDAPLPDEFWLGNE